MPLRLDPSSHRLVRGKGHVNGPDEHALEEALRVRETTGEGEVVVITMAPAHATDAMRHAIAMGADRVTLVADELLAGSDLLATCRVLARALAREQPDLVLFGWESSDGNGAMLWSAVAERLDMPLLSRVWELEVSEGTARARRQMEYGFDIAETDLPCVVALSGATNAPRYPSLKGVVASKRKPIDPDTTAELGLAPDEVGDAGSRTRVLAIRVPPRRTPGTLIEDTANAPEQLLEFLTATGFV